MLLLMFFVFITCFSILYILINGLIVKKEPIQRIKKFTNVEIEVNEKKKSGKIEYKSGFGIISKKIGNVKLFDGYKKHIQVKLTRAHVFLKAEEFMTIMIVGFFVISFLVLVITSNIFFGIVFGSFGFIIPNIFLNIKIKRRIKTLNEQLGDAISLISNSLKAGYSFLQAVETVGEEMDGPISEEFKTLKNEVSFGTKTEIALEKLSERVVSDDLDLVITAVLIQRQIGGNLSEILDNISNTIRERIKIKGDVRALTAQGRMSGIVISLLPPILCFVLFLINRKFMSEFFKEPLGWAILSLALFMECIGIFIIKKIIKIEV